MNVTASLLSVLSPSYQENVPSNIFATAWQRVQLSPRINEQTPLSPYDLIPCDDRDYMTEFHSVDSGLCKSASLASSVVRIMSYSSDKPFMVSLGNEIPISYPRQDDLRVPATDLSVWQHEMPSGEEFLVLGAPDLTKENNSLHTFMILSPRTDMTPARDYKNLFNDDSNTDSCNPDSLFTKPCFIFDDDLAAPHNSAVSSRSTEMISTSISEPLKNIQFSRRLWKQLKTRYLPPHRHNFNLITHFQNFFSKNTNCIKLSSPTAGFEREAATESERSPWVHTKNMLFWDHMFPQKALNFISLPTATTS